MLPFEFIIDGPPVSQQARRRQRVRDWSLEVRNAAQSSWPVNELPETRLVMMTIIHFYDGSSMDVDNIPKPISDGLRGLIYDDDSQIADLVCRKRALRSNLQFINPSVILAGGFSRDREFLYIRVEQAPDQEVIE